MECGGGYSNSSAGVGVEVWGVSVAIIKLQIDITLRRFNGVLWLRTSFAAGSGPRLATTVNVCDFSIFQAGPCRCCLPSTPANFKRANEVRPIKCCHSHSHRGLLNGD